MKETGMFYNQLKSILFILCSAEECVSYLASTFHFQSDHTKLRGNLSVLERVFLKKAKFMWALSQENVSSGVSDKVRLKLACSATEAS